MTFIDPSRLPEVGHPVIDQGHVRLADLANSLYAAWQDGRLDDLEPLARNFVRGLAEHFAAEEQIMAEVELETASEHRRRHAELLTEFEAIAAILGHSRGLAADVMVDLFRAAERLVWEHEMVDDQDFWTHFAGRAPVPQTLIVWDIEVAVGRSEIDEQHRKLIALINDLHSGIAGAMSRESLFGRLTGLRRFTARHFAHEERLMAATPGAHDEAHVTMHAALLADLDRVLADLKAGRYDMVEDLLGTYVKHWLLEHVATMDRRLAEAVAAAREEPQRIRA